MKVIVAGSRQLRDYSLIDKAIKASGFEITEMVSGVGGWIDANAITWANERSIISQPFPADWENLDYPDAIIRTNKWGNQYDALAGIRRNKEMVEYADALIVIGDDKYIMQEAQRQNLKIFIYHV